MKDVVEEIVKESKVVKVARGVVEGKNIVVWLRYDYGSPMPWAVLAGYEENYGYSFPRGKHHETRFFAQ